MKKIILSSAILCMLNSCGSTSNIANTSTLSTAAELLAALSPNSTLAQISQLFGLLDTNKDNGIDTSEAIGSVSENFNALDTDGSSSLNLSELGGLLKLLQ